MNLILIAAGERSFTAADPRARHLRKILRIGEGGSFQAGEIGGKAGTARITSEQGGAFTFAFQPERETVPPFPVDVILGHPRPIVLRRIFRDLCTIGVRRLLVAPTELGEASYFSSTVWDEVQPYLIDGAAQAGTTYLLEVERCTSLAEAVGRISPETVRRFVLHPAGNVPSGDYDASAPAGGSPTGPGGEIVVAVGSERGWTDGELELLRQARFAAASLGPRLLRTESAATVAAWMATVPGAFA